MAIKDSLICINMELVGCFTTWVTAKCKFMTRFMSGIHAAITWTSGDKSLPALEYHVPVLYVQFLDKQIMLILGALVAQLPAKITNCTSSLWSIEVEQKLTLNKQSPHLGELAWQLDQTFSSDTLHEFSVTLEFPVRVQCIWKKETSMS